jgi:hypothetical protein
MGSSHLTLRLSKIKPFFWLVLAGLLALIPLVILVSILATTGTDTISNDYLRFARLADRVLSPGYDWRGYFKDSFDNNVHSYAFLFLFRLVLNELTHLSVMVEIYIGLALSAVKVLILYQLFTRFVPIHSRLRFILLPVISFLIYSLSQFSTYSFGETALQMGWTQVGILIGLWMLLLHPRHRLASWVMAGGGILASYSGGSGVLAWPVFFLAILFTDLKNARKYMAWFIGLGIGLWPYLAYSSYASTGDLQNLLTLLTPRRFLTGLGLPMANNINYAVALHSEAIRSGFFGLLFLLIAGIIFIPFHSRDRIKRAIPGLLLVFWGIMSSLQITASRTYFAPWYTSSLVLFWIGLLGMSTSLLSVENSLPAGKFLLRYRNWIWRAAGLSGLLLVAVLFVKSNHSFEDKSFILPSRSPSAAACLRAYKTAPTFCEGLVFQWGVGNPSYLPEMGAIVDKYHWSVQAPHQEWTLQGDYALGKVSLPFNSFKWVQEDSDQPAVWSDYHYLDLFLNPGFSAEWKVDLPINLNSAVYVMEVSPIEPALCAGASLSVAFSEAGSSNPQIIHTTDLCNGRQTLTQDLRSYAGKSISISIQNESHQAANAVLRLHTPRLELDLDYSAAPPFTAPVVRPSNTDLSAGVPPLPDPAAHFFAPPATGWTLSDLTSDENGGRWFKSGADPSLTYSLSQPLCLADWSDFYLRLAVSDSFLKKFIHIDFKFKAQQDASDTRPFDLPLLAGTDLHTYTLNLDLLNLPASACITSLQIKPNPVAGMGSDLWIQAADFGFLPRQLSQ